MLIEIRAGAHTKESINAVSEIGELFKKVDRVVTLDMRDYERAGAVLSELQSRKGYDIRKIASITNDCLIAVSARSIGAVLYTQNRKDFQAIRDVLDFKISVV